MKRVLTLMLATLICLLSFSACTEGDDFDGADDFSGLRRVYTETYLNDLPGFEEGDSETYKLCFGTTNGEDYYLKSDSNPEQVCCVSNICVNPDYDGDVHLVIPEKSEHGSTVIALDSYDTYTYYFPFCVPKDDFQYILNQMEENLLSDRGRATFSSFYLLYDLDSTTISARKKSELRGRYPWICDFPFYTVEATISRAELKTLATNLMKYTDYRYGEEKANEILGRIKDESARKEAEATFRAQLKCDTSRITELTLPETIELIYISSFGRMDKLQKINGLKKDCKIVYLNDDGSTVMTDISDEAIYESDCLGMKNFLRALENSSLSE